MAVVEKLSIALTPELAADIRRAIEAGEYASVSEVVRDALRTWRNARQARDAALEELRHLWRDGVDSGQGLPFDVEDIRRRGRERLARAGER